MDHVASMAHELQELDERRAALKRFILDSPVFKTLDPEEQLDMHQQLDWMRLYSLTLHRQLNRVAPRAPAVEVVTQ